MLGLSLPEIIFLAVLALVVIGPKQLPEVARTLGRMLSELRRASSSLTDEIREHVKVDPIRLDDPKPHINDTIPAGKSEDGEVKKS
jgi:sec-independent protein translocase protein TatB